MIVTGGSGFIGSNLVNFLIKKKYFVINIDKLTYSSNRYDEKKWELRDQKVVGPKMKIDGLPIFSLKVIYGLR